MINTLTESLNSLLKNHVKAVVISHHNPDGDALGSSMALYHYLKLKGAEVAVVLPNGYPDFLEWMVNSDDKLHIYSPENHQVIQRIINEADAIFCVDFNALHRTGEMADLIKSAKAKKALIDHHLEPETADFDYIYSKTETSSTAELLYEVIVINKDKNLINKQIAEALYVGIITDTGSLSFSNNYASTYKIIADLAELKVDFALIQRLVYSNFTEKRMRLLGLCLSKNLFVLHEFKTAYIALSLEDLKAYNYKPGDSEGIVNYAMAIKGIELAGLFIEREDVIRVSLRSFGNLSVNKMARTLYTGGGHKNAAGANSYTSLKETVEIFLNSLSSLDNFRAND